MARAPAPPPSLAAAVAAPVGRLATTRVDGAVDLVPFVFAWLPGPGDLGRLVSAVDHKPKRHGRLQRLANVEARPAVTVLVDHYDDDWSALWWVRMRGRARVLAGGDPADPVARAALVAKYPQYRTTPPSGAVMEITLDDVRTWSARSPR